MEVTTSATALLLLSLSRWNSISAPRGCSTLLSIPASRKPSHCCLQGQASFLPHCSLPYGSRLNYWQPLPCMPQRLHFPNPSQCNLFPHHIMCALTTRPSPSLPWHWIHTLPASEPPALIPGAANFLNPLPAVKITTQHSNHPQPSQDYHVSSWEISNLFWQPISLLTSGVFWAPLPNLSAHTFKQSERANWAPCRPTSGPPSWPSEVPELDPLEPKPLTPKSVQHWSQNERYPCPTDQPKPSINLSSISAESKLHLQSHNPHINTSNLKPK